VLADVHVGVVEQGRVDLRLVARHGADAGGRERLGLPGAQRLVLARPQHHGLERLRPAVERAQLVAPAVAQRLGQGGVEVVHFLGAGVRRAGADQRAQELAPGIEDHDRGRQRRGAALDRAVALLALGVRGRGARQLPGRHALERLLADVALTRQAAVAVVERGQLQHQAVAQRVERARRRQRVGALLRRVEGLVEPGAHGPGPVVERDPARAATVAQVAGRVVERLGELGARALLAQAHAELLGSIGREVAHRVGPRVGVAAGLVEHLRRRPAEAAERLLHALAPAHQLARGGVQALQRGEVAGDVVQAAPHLGDVGLEGGPAARAHPPRHQRRPQRPHQPHERAHQAAQDARRRQAEHEVEADRHEHEGGHRRQRARRAGEGGARRLAEAPRRLRRGEHDEAPDADRQQRVAEQDPRPGRRVAAHEEQPAEDQQRTRQRPCAHADAAAQQRARLLAELAARQRRGQQTGDGGTQRQQHQADRLEVEAPALATGLRAPGRLCAPAAVRAC
jgi:hypothetical protein